MISDSTEAARNGDGQNTEATLTLQQVAILAAFIDFTELAKRVPLCERSLREAVRRGKIPSIKLPGARRVMFHWDSVQAALLRMQRGAE